MTGWLPDVEVEPDDEVVPDAPGAAYAGAAMVRAVPPMVASPNTKAAAPLAIGF
jgi:hypothetical protein